MSNTKEFAPLNFEYFPADEQLERSQEFLNRMKRRRTVRTYSNKPVAFELICNAILTAGTSPSGSNCQPWTFAVISNPETKHKIRQAAEIVEKEGYEKRMTAEHLAAVAPLGTNWRKPHLEDAPYLIVIFKQAYGFDNEGKKIKHFRVDESIGIATGLLIASLHQAGLATLTHTPDPMKFLAEILKRPSNERATMILAVGYPAEDTQVPIISKKSLDEIMAKYD